MADCGEDATLLIDSKVNASKTLTVSISLVLLSPSPSLYHYISFLVQISSNIQVQTVRPFNWRWSSDGAPASNPVYPGFEVRSASLDYDLSIVVWRLGKYTEAPSD